MSDETVYAQPEKQIYERMRLKEASATARSKKVESLIKKIGMSDEDGEMLISLVSSKGADKGVDEFLKKNPEHKKHQEELDVIASLLEF